MPASDVVKLLFGRKRQRCRERRRCEDEILCTRITVGINEGNGIPFIAQIMIWGDDDTRVFGKFYLLVGREGP